MNVATSLVFLLTIQTTSVSSSACIDRVKALIGELPQHPLLVITRCDRLRCGRWNRYLQRSGPHKGPGKWDQCDRGRNQRPVPSHLGVHHAQYTLPAYDRLWWWCLVFFCRPDSLPRHQLWPVRLGDPLLPAGHRFHPPRHSRHTHNNSSLHCLLYVCYIP